MSDFNPDYIYSLYNIDNGVELYDSLEEAEKVKRRWLEVVPVDGPFQHVRAETKLIMASQRALSALIGLCEMNAALAESQKINLVATELQHALDEFFSPLPAS